MRPDTCLPLVLCSIVAAQELPHADELRGIAMLRGFLAAAESGPAKVHGSVLAGYDARVFADGEHERHMMPFDRTATVLLQPRQDADSQRRLLLGIRGGRILAGDPPSPALTFAANLRTVAAQGTREHINDMVLGWGQAQDGTRWRTLDLQARTQHVVVLDENSRPIAGVHVEIGGSRFFWHPGALPVDDLEVVGCEATTDAQGLAVADGLAARALRLQVSFDRDRTDARIARLDRSMLTVKGDTLTIRVPRDRFVATATLQDQAWAVLALRRLQQLQVDYRQHCEVDADGDGVGEFGAAADVVPPRFRGMAAFGRGEITFRNHRFLLHLPTDVDQREHQFTAYAWPQAKGAVGSAFAVDASGQVFVDDDGRFAGGKDGPAADSLGADAAHWRKL